MPAADAAATGAAVLRSGPGTNPELERPHASNAPATTQAVTFLVERAIRKRARGEALGQEYFQSQKCSRRDILSRRRWHDPEGLLVKVLLNVLTRAGCIAHERPGESATGRTMFSQAVAKVVPSDRRSNRA